MIPRLVTEMSPCDGFVTDGAVAVGGVGIGYFMSLIGTPCKYSKLIFITEHMNEN